MSPLQELRLLLRPAGGGVYLVSSGRTEQEELQRRLYQVQNSDAVQGAFETNLARIAHARVGILAIPSDVGAGYVRGANLGPQAIRTELLRNVNWPSECESKGIVDLGDVFVVPQLLHDSMLSDAQRHATQDALYSQVPDGIRRTLPVSPLSIAERALDLIRATNPNLKMFAIGGDHSCAWPVTASLAKFHDDFGIVQPDAHTDLLHERLGVKYCFATWSYHANELLGRNGKLTQVGIRATRYPKDHWESQLGVKQFWANECVRNPKDALDAMIDHVRSTKVKSIYFSNDIDGTDSSHADATGTPEPAGLEPEFVLELIDRLGNEIGLIAGDIMEVAPLAARTPGGKERTVELAARYARATLDAMVGPQS